MEQSSIIQMVVFANIQSDSLHNTVCLVNWKPELCELNWPISVYNFVVHGKSWPVIEEGRRVVWLGNSIHQCNNQVFRQANTVGFKNANDLIEDETHKLLEPRFYILIRINFLL
eukprot:TRINITY_DN14147_c0_g1_i1.p2 TRINITY_DN14147_c0_g1~~TRINITY_DN14147_c0_g1_i1.p2  ORF type:complete len:128 (-),score=17.85 TRINITY_DN14147_c0_g1_i1:98-439(-)